MGCRLKLMVFFEFYQIYNFDISFSFALTLQYINCPFCIAHSKKYLCKRGIHFMGYKN